MIDLAKRISLAISLGADDEPADVIMRQIAALQGAIATLVAAIDKVTGEVNPETATWSDVSRLAHLVDAVGRAGICEEG